MKLKRLTLVIAATLASAAYAIDDHAHGGGLSDGEIRKVDRDAQKLTIKHGPLKNLDMPGMTMVFRVKDPAMLEQVKKGDKVKFEAEEANGQYTVTRIERAR